MKVGVEMLTGCFFHVEVEGEEATVGGLKRAITTKDQTLPEQRLILILGDGRLLRDEQCALADCGVADGSVVYLFFTSVGNPNWLTFFEDFVTFFVREC